MIFIFFAIPINFICLAYAKHMNFIWFFKCIHTYIIVSGMLLVYENNNKKTFIWNPYTCFLQMHFICKTNAFHMCYFHMNCIYANNMNCIYKYEMHMICVAYAMHCICGKVCCVRIGDDLRQAPAGFHSSESRFSPVILWVGSRESAAVSLLNET